MPVRIAINGFGRTGRAAFRAAYESGADLEWVAINDIADPAMLAHLLKHDTVYGPFSIPSACLGTTSVSMSSSSRPVVSAPAQLRRSTSRRGRPRSSSPQVAWYDNEWGYSNRLVELAQKVLVRRPAMA